MAAVASSAVTILKQWIEQDRAAKTVNKVMEALITLSSQGGSTNYIGAGLFNMTAIRECSCVVTDGDTWIEAKPSYDGSKLLIFNPAQATDANRTAAADISDTIRVVVKGW